MALAGNVARRPGAGAGWVRVWPTAAPLRSVRVGESWAGAGGKDAANVSRGCRKLSRCGAYCAWLCCARASAEALIHAGASLARPAFGCRPAADRRGRPAAVRPQRRSAVPRTLGWQPTVEFEAGFRRTVAWYRDHPQWWQPLLARSAVDEAAWQRRS